MAVDERLYWIWLAESLGQGSAAAAELIRQYGNPCRVFETPPEELRFPEHYAADSAARARNRLKNRSLTQAEEILEHCEKLGISVIPCGSERYPKALTDLSDMPILLYLRGSLPDSRKYLYTTVVGTRSMTDYGRKMSYALGAGLAFGGSVVVSGMALGTDSMALIGALDAGGTAVAVLGSGVDVIYPREHRELYYKILERGAILSEYPPGTPPTGSHFPVRNRIMSGMSSGTVVVEAGESSGSLITARKAIAQGRKLFAVPGKIGDENSAGANALLQDGACAAVCAEDILAEFEFLYPDTVNLQNAHARMRRLDLDTLSRNAMNRSRISAGSRNYYGSGSYGGRADRVANASSEGKQANPPRQPEREKPVEQPNRTERPEQRMQRTEQPMPKPERQSAESHPKPQPKENEKPERTGKPGVREVISSVISPIVSGLTGKTEKQTVNSDEKVVPAEKIELDMLDENEIKVYNTMKPNVPTLPDELVEDGRTMSDVLSALTVLEMTGAVESGGSGYFVRLSQDEDRQPPNE